MDNVLKFRRPALSVILCSTGNWFIFLKIRCDIPGNHVWDFNDFVNNRVLNIFDLLLDTEQKNTKKLVNTDMGSKSMENYLNFLPQYLSENLRFGLKSQTLSIHHFLKLHGPNV